MFNEALSTAEMFTDEELRAVQRGARGTAMWMTEYIGAPWLFADFLHSCRIGILDQMIADNIDVVKWCAESPPHRPLRAAERMTPSARRKLTA